MNDRDTAGYDEIEPTGLNPAQRFDNIDPSAAHGRPRPLARGRFGLRTRMGGGDPTPVITHRVGCPSSPMQASIALARAIGCYFDCDPEWGYCNPLWGPIVQVRSKPTGCGVAFGACARHASTYQVPPSRRSGAPLDLGGTGHFRGSQPDFDHEPWPFPFPFPCPFPCPFPFPFVGSVAGTVVVVAVVVLVVVVVVVGGTLVVVVVLGGGAVVVALVAVDVEAVVVAGAGDKGVAARWRLPRGVRGTVVGVAAPAAAA